MHHPLDHPGHLVTALMISLHGILRFTLWQMMGLDLLRSLRMVRAELSKATG